MELRNKLVEVEDAFQRHWADPYTSSTHATPIEDPRWLSPTRSGPETNLAALIAQTLSPSQEAAAALAKALKGHHTSPGDDVDAYTVQERVTDIETVESSLPPGVRESVLSLIRRGRSDAQIVSHYTVVDYVLKEAQVLILFFSFLFFFFLMHHPSQPLSPSQQT